MYEHQRAQTLGFGPHGPCGNTPSASAVGWRLRWYVMNDPSVKLLLTETVNRMAMLVPLTEESLGMGYM